MLRFGLNIRRPVEEDELHLVTNDPEGEVDPVDEGQQPIDSQEGA